jgi:hypothetical protein
MVPHDLRETNSGKQSPRHVYGTRFKQHTLRF